MSLALTRCLHDLYNLVRLQLNLTLQNTDRPLRHQFRAATCGLQPHQGQEQFYIICDMSPPDMEGLMQSKKTGLTRHAISKALHCPSFAKSIFAPNVTAVGAAFLLLFLRFLAWGSWPSRTKHKAFSISILFSPRSITWWEKPTLTLGSRFDFSMVEKPNEVLIW